MAPTRITDALLRSWPLPSLAHSEGKEDRGRIAVVGGSRHVPGAALLAAEATLRVGAGKLHIATAASAQASMAMAVPEAKVSAVQENASGNLIRLPVALERELATADAILVGPGMDTGAAAVRLVQQIASVCQSQLILDAGALDGFSASLAHVQGRIITPHFGEMARLLGRPVEEIEKDPGAVATSFARETRTVVVLKSPTTYVASPDGECWIHTDGSVGLGTSGSGDVLAGLIAGLVARGAPLAQAAVWGVRLHGKAGELLSLRMGSVGFLAREISPEVPRLVHQLDASADQSETSRPSTRR